jgi:hypothetical protein
MIEVKLNINSKVTIDQMTGCMISIISQMVAAGIDKDIILNSMMDVLAFEGLIEII